MSKAIGAERRRRNEDGEPRAENSFHSRNAVLKSEA
jgi:hypothetical protein